MGDHESSAGVVTDETTTGQIAFNLQSKQIPAERQTERERQGEKRQKAKRLMLSLLSELLKALPLTLHCQETTARLLTSDQPLIEKMAFSVNHCTVGY